MKQDIAMKKGKFIGKVNYLAQMFHFASPGVLMTILNTYCTSFHGSGNYVTRRVKDFTRPGMSP